MIAAVFGGQIQSLISLFIGICPFVCILHHTSEWFTNKLDVYVLLVINNLFLGVSAIILNLSTRF